MTYRIHYTVMTKHFQILQYYTVGAQPVETPSSYRCTPPALLRCTALRCDLSIFLSQSSYGHALTKVEYQFYTIVINEEKNCYRASTIRARPIHRRAPLFFLRFLTVGAQDMSFLTQNLTWRKTKLLVYIYRMKIPMA